MAEDRDGLEVGQGGRPLLPGFAERFPGVLDVGAILQRLYESKVLDRDHRDELLAGSGQDDSLFVGGDPAEQLRESLVGLGGGEGGHAVSSGGSVLREAPFLQPAPKKNVEGKKKRS